MNKVVKGCLWTSGIVICILFIVSVSIYFYATSSNEIIYKKSPIKIEANAYELSFPNRKIPDLIINQNEDNILYQIYMEDSGLDMTTIYKVVIQLDKPLNLDNSMPITASEKEKLNNRIAFSKIEDSFNPIINLPDDNETASGRHLTIYSKKDEIKLNITNGSYTYYYDEIDKDGSVSEILIFDKNSKILYYERNRYHAFQ